MRAVFDECLITIALSCREPRMTAEAHKKGGITAGFNALRGE